MSVLRQERAWLAALLGVVTLSHFLLPLNTGLYGDDYMLVDWLRAGDWARLYEVGDTMGNLGYTAMYWPFHKFAHPATAIKVAVFACLLGTAVFLYLSVLEIGLVDRFGAFFVAAAGVIYPAHTMTFAVNICGHFFSYFAFAFAAWCVLRSERTARASSRWGYRLAAWASFVVSYITPSFLAFHYGFLLVLFLRPRTGEAGLAPRIAAFLRGHWDLVVLPVVFWALHQRFNPVHGWAKEMGYNEIKLTADQLLPVYRNLWEVVAGEWWSYSVHYLACLVLAAVWIRATGRESVFRRADGREGAARRDAVLVAVGVLWLILAAFPYAAVGKEFGVPGVIDWESRNRLLLQIPLAILLLGAAGLFFARRPRLRTAALAGALLLFVFARISGYLVWQAQAIKDESVRYHLLRDADVRRYHVLVFHDNYDIVNQASPHGNDVAFWWSYVLKWTYGDFTRFGIYEGDAERARAARRYTERDIALLKQRHRAYPADFDAELPQASVLIERGPLAGKRWLPVDYYVARLRGEATLSRFLSGVTKVAVRERR